LFGAATSSGVELQPTDGNKVSASLKVNVMPEPNGVGNDKPQELYLLSTGGGLIGVRAHSH